MAIPEQVKKRAEDAEKLQQELYGTPGEDVTGEQPPLPAKDVQETVPEEKTIAALNDKYKVLKGKYDAETRQARAEIARLNGTVDVLQRQIADLNRRTAQPKPDKPQKPAAPVEKFVPTEHLSEDEIKRLDEEGLDKDVLSILGKAFVKAAAANVPKPDTSTVENRVKKLEETQQLTAKQQKQLKEQSYWEQVDNALTREGFDRINNDPRFYEVWLKQPVSPYTQMTRKQALDQAHNRLDSKTVIQIFNDFKKEVLKEKPKNDVVEPKSSVTPDRANVEQASNLNKDQLLKKWTPERIRKHYSDVSRGVFKNNPELQKKNEAEIWEANRAAQGL